jgi:hypothetical protein
MNSLTIRRAILLQVASLFSGEPGSSQAKRFIAVASMPQMLGVTRPAGLRAKSGAGGNRNSEPD